MSNHNLQLVCAAAPRVDGIDLAQLLRDLGDASATNSAVDLFSLCLKAQRVLTQMHARSSTSLGEVQMLGYFRAMSNDCQVEVMCMMESLADAYPRHRPSLTLV